MIDVFKSKNFEFCENENALVSNGNCLDVLKQIKDNQIDLIFADPPYNLGKDFGNDSDTWLDREDYLEWCYEWIDECFRVLKKEGTFYLMNSTQNIPFISVYILNAPQKNVLTSCEHYCFFVNCNISCSKIIKNFIHLLNLIIVFFYFAMLVFRICLVS